VSSALFDSVARIARHESRARLGAAAGKVVDVFPAGDGQADHAVSVELRDSQVVLPRVPVAVGLLGFAAIPARGELVLILFLDGDANAPVVAGRLYHPDQARLSVGANAEMLVTVDGRGGGRTEIAAGSAKITIKKDGDITISTSGNLKLEGADVEISGTSKVKISGPQVEIN
jgi:hypothetical protein